MCFVYLKSAFITNTLLILFADVNILECQFLPSNNLVNSMSIPGSWFIYSSFAQNNGSRKDFHMKS